MEACNRFGCKLNLYSYHVKSSAGTMPLESFNLVVIKESVKAAAPATAPAAAAAAASLVAFNYLIFGQAPISSVAALRAINPHLKPGTGYTKKGFVFEDYSTMIEWAGKEAADGPLGYRCFALVVKVECGLQLHLNTVGKEKRRLLAARTQARKGAPSPGDGTAVSANAKAEPPQRQGGTAQYPHEGAVNLTAWMHRMCAHKLPVFKCTIMSVENSQTEVTKWKANWPDSITEKWYYHYLRKFNLRTGTVRPLEISRAKWTTSANMKIHYNMVVEVLVRLKIAVRNPDFVQDAAGRKGEDIFIVKPRRLFSWD